ncbi:hypothetical protein ACVNF4_03155 [Streptomyces sp. S6]
MPKAFAGDLEDPATWRLLTETYAPTRAQTHMVSAARDQLIDACTDKRDFPERTVPERERRTTTSSLRSSPVGPAAM